MKTSDFDFDLPDSAIALRPASPRDHARLLHLGQSIEDKHVYDLPDLLKAGDVLVFNNTKVLPAALKAIRPARAVGGGGDVSVTVNLHKCVDERTWRAFVKPAKRLRVGDTLIFSDHLTAEVIDKQDGGDTALEFSLSDQLLSDEIARVGDTPLPPYIARQRETDHQDKTDYQTIYAKDTGSVAAPTAGLHFTSNVMDALKDKAVQLEYLTLHVGAGTFLPVKTDNLSDHKMHSEWFTLSKGVASRINAAKAEGRRVIAVGTTALRALESAAQDGSLKPCSGETDIFITPGYDFRVIDGLMTNFHLPRSTLFMLVCALAGTDKMKAAYQHAIETGYRFYSYGDSSLLWRA